MTQDLLNTQIWQGKSVGDLLALEKMAPLAGSVVGTIVILLIGWIIVAWVGRRVRRISLEHVHLDHTLFNFLGSVVHYVIFLGLSQVLADAGMVVLARHC